MAERCTALVFHPHQENQLIVASASCNVYSINVGQCSVLPLLIDRFSFTSVSKNIVFIPQMCIYPMTRNFSLIIYSLSPSSQPPPPPHRGRHSGDDGGTQSASGGGGGRVKVSSGADI